MVKRIPACFAESLLSVRAPGEGYASGQMERIVVADQRSLALVRLFLESCRVKLA
jgi:hypothetical protein